MASSRYFWIRSFLAFLLFIIRLNVSFPHNLFHLLTLRAVFDQKANAKLWQEVILNNELNPTIHRRLPDWINLLSKCLKNQNFLFWLVLFSSKHSLTWTAQPDAGSAETAAWRVCQHHPSVGLCVLPLMCTRLTELNANIKPPGGGPQCLTSWKKKSV